MSPHSFHDDDDYMQRHDNDMAKVNQSVFLKQPIMIFQWEQYIIEIKH